MRLRPSFAGVIVISGGYCLAVPWKYVLRRQAWRGVFWTLRYYHTVYGERP